MVLKLSDDPYDVDRRLRTFFLDEENDLITSSHHPTSTSILDNSFSPRIIRFILERIICFISSGCPEQ